MYQPLKRLSFQLPNMCSVNTLVAIHHEANEGREEEI
jgi:hypothetical protein